VGVRSFFPSKVELSVFMIRGDFGYWTTLCYTPRVICYCTCGRCGGFLFETKKKNSDTLFCVFLHHHIHGILYSLILSR